VTSTKLVILGLIIIVSLSCFNKDNFDPFLDPEEGPVGLVEASTILFFGYLGFDFITTVSEEAKNPQRDIPMAIQVSLVLSMFIYALISFAVNGVARLSESEGDGETAIAEIFQAKGMNWMAYLVFLAAILGITAAAFTNIMSQVRILYS